MPISPARKAAYDILHRVDSGRDFAVDLLQSPAVSALKDLDRRLATEIVMGVLRWRGELDFHIERLARRKLVSLDPEVLTILRMGCFQIRFLERVPKFAIVDDAVEITKSIGKVSASGLVNAVLRKCSPDGSSLISTRWEGLTREGKQAIQPGTRQSPWLPGLARRPKAGRQPAGRPPPWRLPPRAQQISLFL